MDALSFDRLQNLGLAAQQPTANENSDELDQTDFLKLLTVQLTTQDPLKPVENEDFIAQMAQFSTVTGIESLTKSFETLAQSLSQGQALQAATLVGRNVLVPAESAQLAEGGTISGAIELENSVTSASIEVLDASGASVRNFALDNTGAGLQSFTWDGLLADGTVAPPGTYQFRATVMGQSNAESITTLLNKPVDTVAIGEDGALELSVQGVGNINFSDVKRIS